MQKLTTGPDHCLQSSKPFLAVAAGLGELADSQDNDTLIGTADERFKEHLAIISQYCKTYNITESIIDTYDGKISLVWGEDWREAFSSLTPSRAKHMFGTLKKLSQKLDLERAVVIVSQVVGERAHLVSYHSNIFPVF